MADAAVEFSRGSSHLHSLAHAHAMFDRLCLSKCFMRGSDSADIAARSGSCSKQSFANDQAVVVSCRADNLDTLVRMRLTKSYLCSPLEPRSSAKRARRCRAETQFVSSNSADLLRQSTRNSWPLRTVWMSLLRLVFELLGVRDRPLELLLPLLLLLLRRPRPWPSAPQPRPAGREPQPPASGGFIAGEPGPRRRSS